MKKRMHNKFNNKIWLLLYRYTHEYTKLKICYTAYGTLSQKYVTLSQCLIHM